MSGIGSASPLPRRCRGQSGAAGLLIVLLVATAVAARAGDTYATDPDPTLGGPNGVDPQIRTWRDRPSVFDFDPTSPLKDWRSWLNEEHGIAFRSLNFLLYQKADRDSAAGDDDALGGVLRFLGKWDVLRDTSYPGRFEFRLEARDALGNPPAPTNLGVGLGVRALNTGFIYVEDFDFDLTVAKWSQTFLDDRIGISAGILAFDVYQDVYPFQSIAGPLLNRAFIVNPAIATTGVGALGIVARGHLNDNFWMGAQVYDAAAENGTAFWNTIDSGEFLKNAEIGWTPSRDRWRTDRVLITFWHTDKRSDPGVSSGWGGVLSASYQVWDPLVAFVRAGHNDGGGVAPARTSVSAGFEYTPFESQALALGFSWGEPATNGFRDEYLVETSYRVQVTPNLSIMPDFQFVVDPAVAEDDFLFVFSLRTILSF